MAKNSCQKKPKFLEILGTKVVQFWCYTKLIKTKKLLLNWYFSIKIFFRKIRMIFDVENWLKNQILALFDSYFWPFNKSHEKIIAIFVISATMGSIWNVFIKFRWHDEKLTMVKNQQTIKRPKYQEWNCSGTCFTNGSHAMGKNVW